MNHVEPIEKVASELSGRHVLKEATLRFSRTTIGLASEDGGTVKVDAGGVQTGAGLRLRF